MIHSLLNKLFSRSPGSTLLAKLAETHSGIFSAERRRDKERREAASRIAAHELKISECRLAIRLHREAIRCEQRQLDLLELSRSKQIAALRVERIGIVNELRAKPVDREARELARLLEAEAH